MEHLGIELTELFFHSGSTVPLCNRILIVWMQLTWICHHAVLFSIVPGFFTGLQCDFPNMALFGFHIEFWVM